MINGFAMFVRESPKAGKSRSDAPPTGNTNYVVLHWDAPRHRTNGFIRERQSPLRSIGGAPQANNPTAVRLSQDRRHTVIKYDWLHS
jgi:hypothetical protein